MQEVVTRMHGECRGELLHLSRWRRIACMATRGSMPLLSAAAAAAVDLTSVLIVTVWLPG